MATDWSKVLEVFGSGIIGVFVVMFLLQLLTQFSTRVIEWIENWNREEQQEQNVKPQGAVAKEKA